MAADCKMTPFTYHKSTILLILLPLMGHAQVNSTFHRENISASNQKSSMILNLTSVRTECKLQVEPSSLENVLRLMRNRAIHVVDLKVSVNLGNKTRNFGQLRWPWASEIGRTIISLKGRTKIHHSNYRNTKGESIGTISSLHFITLNPGFKELDVVVFEESYGCLPTGNNGSERIFDFLLRNLSYSDDTYDYNLCRPKRNDHLKLYSCCRVAGGGKLTICSEYSSLILEYAGNYVTAIVYVILYIGFPLLRQYLQSIPKETEHYIITDSPMALSRMFYSVFMEGSNSPVTPFYRRFTFSVTVVVIGCISLSPVEWYFVLLLCLWAILFTVFDFFGINDDLGA